MKSEFFCDVFIDELRSVNCGIVVIGNVMGR